ncbi:MAG: hypothetical protein JKX76_01660 [Colwellia sp.]|nr:hypothetical protein [Colwellia sp.]
MKFLVYLYLKSTLPKYNKQMPSTQPTLYFTYPHGAADVRKVTIPTNDGINWGSVSIKMMAYKLREKRRFMRKNH